MKETLLGGLVLEMQDFSLLEDDSIRTVIYLAGCPMRCRWCPTPESWTLNNRLAFEAEKCIHCDNCAEVCPQGLAPASPDFCQEDCLGCGSCGTVCPSDALSILCREEDVEELARRISRDNLLYGVGSGGITFSGGEPTFQLGFLRGLAGRFARMGISMHLETCGFFDWEEARDIFYLMDRVFLAIKYMGPEHHRLLTGVDNAQVLANCRHLYAEHIPLTIRVPLIPGLTMDEANLIATADFVRDELPGTPLELLAYEPRGLAKYNLLRLGDVAPSFRRTTQQELAWAAQLMRSRGVNLLKTR